MATIEQKQTLLSALRNYERWVREGQPKHREQQHYYDGYHEAVYPTDSPDVFRFSVQTFDSPDGDTWWRGEFRLIDGIDVELLKSVTETN